MYEIDSIQLEFPCGVAYAIEDIHCV